MALARKVCVEAEAGAGDEGEDKGEDKGESGDEGEGGNGGSTVSEAGV